MTEPRWYVCPRLPWWEVQSSAVRRHLDWEHEVGGRAAATIAATRPDTRYPEPDRETVDEHQDR